MPIASSAPAIYSPKAEKRLLHVLYNPNLLVTTDWPREAPLTH